MAFQLDVTLKEIAQKRYADFVAAFHMSPNPSGVLNVDLSTLTIATDVAYGFGDPLESITDLNFQSGQFAGLPNRTLMYNVVLHHRHGVPVRSVIILLSPVADHRNLTGRLTYAVPGQPGKLEFEYEVIRLWEVPVEQLMAGGPGVLPLAVLCRMPESVSVEEAMTAVVREIERRLLAELPRPEAALLMAAAFILTGTRVGHETGAHIFQGVGLMQDSSTYQIILDEGEVRGERRTLLRLGRTRFGQPSPEIEATINAINDIDRLARMLDAILPASSWEEVIATP